jgi:hypothetical protein
MIRPIKDSSGQLIEMERHKYKMSNLILTYKDQTEPITIYSNLVKSFTTCNDFENNVTPSYLLSLTVPKVYYEKIRTNMSSLTVTFSLYRIFVGVVKDESKQEYAEQENVNQEILYKNFTLKAIDDSSISVNTINRLPKDVMKNPDSTATEDYTQDLLPLDLYLYDFESLKKYKINSSFIIDGGINDCIYQIFKSRGFEKLLVDSVPSNVSSQYVVPYGHLGDNISKLNEYYGIYDYPYLFYIGSRRVYLINKGNLGRCLEKGELGSVNIYLEKLDSGSITVESGCYCDDNAKLYMLNGLSFDIVDNDSAIDYVAGGNITTVIRGTGEIKHDIIGDYDVERSFVVNNSKQHSQLIYSIKESRRNVSLIFENVDIDIFTPNKSYRIIPDETYYSSDYNIGGKYRLSHQI